MIRKILDALGGESPERFRCQPASRPRIRAADCPDGGRPLGLRAALNSEKPLIAEFAMPARPRKRAPKSSSVSIERTREHHFDHLETLVRSR
jgi:hypothetical protein